jgi:ATPase subunit of ABC transporter with duplicated ATPase domains
VTLLQCRGLGYSVGTRSVLTDITLSVEREERVGLVGTNGSGKSTLLGLLAGTLVADRGERLQKKGLKLELVSQFLPPELRARQAFELVLERAEAEHEARALLTRLGFDEATWSLRAEQLSGGWVNRLMLARAAASAPDLILLDEPTNHLDVESVVYVERFLTEELRSAFIVVSHDRELLDSLTERTLFLREGRIHGFALAYSQARHALLTQESDALALRNVQERKLDAVRASMKRLAHWGLVYDSEKFARRARSMGKRIERMEAQQQPPPWRDPRGERATRRTTARHRGAHGGNSAREAVIFHRPAALTQGRPHRAIG